MKNRVKKSWNFDGQYITQGVRRIGEIFGVLSDGKTTGARIVADHNACIGIEDPETTVPELVVMIGKLMSALEECAYADVDLLTEAAGLLTKTGKCDDPPQP